MSSRLCSPAAAISSARFACAWPRTSRRSAMLSRDGGRRRAVANSQRARSRRVRDDIEQMLRDSDAAARHEQRLRNVGRRHDHAMPGARRRDCREQRAAHGPDLAAERQLAVQLAARRTAAARPAPKRAGCRARSAGRSARLPCGRSAGDRLTVMRPSGIRKPQLTIAARTRSLLSFTTASGKPTIAKRGRPLPRWTSTRTSGASMPCCARLKTVAIAILGSLRACSRGPQRASHAATAWQSALFWPFSKRCEARFQRFELLARAAQHRRLDVEFLPRDQVEAREPDCSTALKLSSRSRRSALRPGGTAAAAAGRDRR